MIDLQSCRLPPHPSTPSRTLSPGAHRPAVSALSVFGEDEEPGLAEEELVVGCGRSFPRPPRSHVAHAEGDEEIGPHRTAAQTQTRELRRSSHVWMF